jgi:hypothetical protein
MFEMLGSIPGVECLSRGRVLLLPRSKVCSVVRSPVVAPDHTRASEVARTGEVAIVGEAFGAEYAAELALGDDDLGEGVRRIAGARHGTLPPVGVLRV